MRSCEWFKRGKDLENTCHISAMRKIFTTPLKNLRGNEEGETGGPMKAAGRAMETSYVLKEG